MLRTSHIHVLPAGIEPYIPKRRKRTSKLYDWMKAHNKYIKRKRKSK